MLQSHRKKYDVKFQQYASLYLYFKSLNHPVLVLGGTRTFNILSFAQTHKPSCPGACKRIIAYPRF